MAGRVLQLQLDTGSVGGLTVSKRQWRQLSPEFPRMRLKKNTAFYPYIGRLPCRYRTLDNLRVGNGTLERSTVSVFPDDSILWAGGDGLIGTACSHDTIVVLDFQRMLLWVANSIE